MKYPVFASFIILILVIRHAIRRNRRIGEEAENSFWKREHDANEVRRKPLDDLIYVKPDTSSFPMDILADDPEIADCRRLISELSEQKIVNLTGLTNTDLKLRYGVANLPLLTEYDDRYTLLVQTLQKWADRLWETGHAGEAIPILEEQVRIHADISSVYRKLAKYYRENGTPEKIDDLKKTAETLNSASKASILRYLDEI
ncbi:MAG: hypothetical protein K6F65_05375 [Lachnospiraceae bacterium]|nr:hypothetical protein [Lachnospiraceae bacterium]